MKNIFSNLEAIGITIFVIVGFVGVMVCYMIIKEDGWSAAQLPAIFKYAGLGFLAGGVLYGVGHFGLQVGSSGSDLKLIAEHYFQSTPYTLNGDVLLAEYKGHPIEISLTSYTHEIDPKRSMSSRFYAVKTIEFFIPLKDARGSFSIRPDLVRERDPKYAAGVLSLLETTLKGMVTGYPLSNNQPIELKNLGLHLYTENEGVVQKLVGDASFLSGLKKLTDNHTFDSLSVHLQTMKIGQRMTVGKNQTGIFATFIFNVRELNPKNKLTPKERIIAEKLNLKPSDPREELAAFMELMQRSWEILIQY